MGNQILARKPKEGEAWDVAVVGSGPSGLTAAIYTTRGAASTVILGGEKWGGQLMLTSLVDNFPGFPEGILGSELMQKMKDQAVRFGADFKSVNVSKIEKNGIFFQLSAGSYKLTAKTVIIATGAETKWLDVPGEKEFIGRGVSSCAPCDAPFFKDKKVLVVGGGDSAMEEALILTKYANEVIIIHRKDEFRASKAMQKKVFENKKISVIWNMQIIKIIGQEKFEKVLAKDLKTGKDIHITADGIFVAIGHTPSTEMFKGLINLDEKGYIIKKDGSETNIDGIFVSGDVHDFKYRQAITAAGLGCQAGMDALSYLDKIKALRQN